MMYKPHNYRPNVVRYEKPEVLDIRRRAVELCSIQLVIRSESRELPLSLKKVNFK